MGKVEKAIEYFTEFLEVESQLEPALGPLPAVAEHYRTALAALERQQRPTTNDGVLIVPGGDYLKRIPNGYRRVTIVAVTLTSTGYHTTDDEGHVHEPSDLYDHPGKAIA